MRYSLSNDLYAPTKAMSSVSALDDGLLCSWLVIPPFCVFFFFLLDSPVTSLTSVSAISTVDLFLTFLGGPT